MTAVDRRTRFVGPGAPPSGWRGAALLTVVAHRARQRRARRRRRQDVQQRHRLGRRPRLQGQPHQRRTSASASPPASRSPATRTPAPPAESRAINLGVIGVTLAGEGCDGGDPTLPEEDQPQPLIARLRRGGRRPRAFDQESEQPGVDREVRPGHHRTRSPRRSPPSPPLGDPRPPPTSAAAAPSATPASSTATTREAHRPHRDRRPQPRRRRRQAPRHDAGRRSTAPAPSTRQVGTFTIDGDRDRRPAGPRRATPIAAARQA